MADETLAIARNVRYGVGDRGKVCLVFDTYVGDSTAALQVLYQPEADQAIEAWGVSDVHDIEGRPCWVEGDRAGGIIRFLRPARAGA